MTFCRVIMFRFNGASLKLKRMTKNIIIEYSTLASMNWQRFESARKDYQKLCKVDSRSSCPGKFYCIIAMSNRNREVETKTFYMKCHPWSWCFKTRPTMRSCRVSLVDSKLWIWTEQLQTTTFSSFYWSHFGSWKLYFRLTNLKYGFQWGVTYTRTLTLIQLCSTIQPALFEGAISVSNFVIDLKSIKFRRANAGCRDKRRTWRDTRNKWGKTENESSDALLSNTLSSSTTRTESQRTVSRKTVTKNLFRKKDRN